MFNIFLRFVICILTRFCKITRLVHLRLITGSLSRYVHFKNLYTTRVIGEKKCTYIHIRLQSSFSLSFSLALPFLLSAAATLECKAAARSASNTSWWRHQSPKHINARIEDARSRLCRWLMRIRPRLNDRSTSTTVAKTLWVVALEKDMHELTRRCVDIDCHVRKTRVQILIFCHA